MKIEDIRRANLKTWVQQNGVPSREKSYFSQLLKEGNSFGERAARRLERTYRMGEHYLDRSATSQDAFHAGGIGGMDDLPPVDGAVLVWERPEDLPPDEDRVWIDRYDYSFSAGNGLIQWEVRQKKALPFDIGYFKALGSKPKDCRLLIVRGDSMEPYLFNRDMMMVDSTKTRIRDGQVYAIYFEDEPLVKQIFKQPGGGIVLHSYNSAKYPDKIIAPDQMEFIKIVGEVIHRAGSGLAGGN